MDLFVNKPLEYLHQLDEFLTIQLGSRSYTRMLLSNSASKYITEGIFVTAFLMLSYEIIYWTGIYLNLWEYHAKDIFTEIPVHCAHVYVRVNVIHKEKLPDLAHYYKLKQKSRFNLLNWNLLNQESNKLFELKRFVKYHFEFSPEDFETNPEPEFGSTIEHLRHRIIDLFNSSDLYTKYHHHKLNKNDVQIYNSYNEVQGKDKDKRYLVKCGIETGDVVDCIVVYS